MTVEYAVAQAPGLVAHGWLGAMLFRDKAETRWHITREDFEFTAQIKSGDYFVTLATKLDSMAKEIDNYRIKTEIEDIVSDLIHLQDHYTIKALKEK